MRHLEISATQNLVNKINAKQDFTVDLKESNKRYVVSNKELYKGKNPSTQCNLIVDVNKVLNKTSSKVYDSLGGWLDRETGLYYLDLNIHYHDLQVALAVAESCNQLAIYDKVEEKIIKV